MAKSFCKFPLILIENADYLNLSVAAKLLYALMLDRYSLSIKNKWKDENKKTYFVYTIEQVCRILNCKRDKAIKTVKELVAKNLIVKRTMGLGKPNYYYVENSIWDSEKADSMKSETPTLEVDNADFCRVDKTDCSYINLNSNINNSNTHFSQSNAPGYDPKEVERIIKDNIEYEILAKDETVRIEQVDEYIDIMVEEICNQSENVKIGEGRIPREILRKRYFSFDSETMKYVLDRIGSLTTQIGNHKGYIRTTLFNAPATIETYYANLVNHDLYGD